MTHPIALRITETDLTGLAHHRGRIVVLAEAGRAPGPAFRRLDRATRGALARAHASDSFAKLKPGEAMDIAFPAGLVADAVQLVHLPRRATLADARRAGGQIGRALAKGALTPGLPVVEAPGTLVLAEGHPRAADLAFGLALRSYDFAVYKSDAAPAPGPVTLMVANPESVAAAAADGAALAEGVFFTRDLVNEPANVLTTHDFAARLAAMQELGLSVEILEEDDLAKLGMGALLAVGQGSESPSKVVVMQWHGGAAGQPPLALVGKGVCFDTGGISLKPPAGMEEMTMDMGGAAVVAGVMRTLALRKARANVVGLVGLVENMPDARATRPGDIVRSMKGDRIEVINTDAEGRLVLADVLWYAQERFAPAAIVDLATLTGAIVVALGSDHAGLYANDDALAGAILSSAQAMGEGAWRMPLAEAQGARLKSRLADVMNVGGREAGAGVAAAFLQRFIKPGTPWAHLDIAGVTLAKSDSALAPKGATGWGVISLDHLIRNHFGG